MQKLEQGKIQPQRHSTSLGVIALHDVKSEIEYEEKLLVEYRRQKASLV
jgi:hypothetical protein